MHFPVKNLGKLAVELTNIIISQEKWNVNYNYDHQCLLNMFYWMPL